MTVQRLEGPRLNALSGTTRQLVIILHGYGADGADLISLGQQWQRQLPDAEFVAPNAPQFCQNPPMGYQWFPLKVTERGVVSTPEERLQGAEQALPTLMSFIEGELARTDLPHSALALVGFSQGAMMALHAGLRLQSSPAAIVSYSGMLLDHENLGMAPSRPPVFLAHGSLDEIVPFAAMSMTQKALGLAGCEVSAYVEEGIGHGIDGEATWLGGEFLAKKLIG